MDPKYSNYTTTSTVFFFCYILLHLNFSLEILMEHMGDAVKEGDSVTTSRGAGVVLEAGRRSAVRAERRHRADERFCKYLRI